MPLQSDCSRIGSAAVVAEFLGIRGVERQQIHLRANESRGVGRVGRNGKEERQRCLHLSAQELVLGGWGAAGHLAQPVGQQNDLEWGSGEHAKARLYKPARPVGRLKNVLSSKPEYQFCKPG